MMIVLIDMFVVSGVASKVRFDVRRVCTLMQSQETTITPICS